jgi:hypothetical protein
MKVIEKIGQLWDDSKERLTHERYDSINALAMSEIFVK